MLRQIKENESKFGHHLSTPIFRLTTDTAEESQCGGVSSVGVHPLVVRRRHRDGDSYGLVELPATRLDSHDGTDHHPVPQDFLDHIITDWLGLGVESKRQQVLSLACFPLTSVFAHS